MPVSDRAAQFAPFAALTGYGDCVSERARYTEERPSLSPESKAAIDRTLCLIDSLRQQRPLVTLLRFVPDERKSGGFCTKITARVRYIDRYRKLLVTDDGAEIPLRDILELSLVRQKAELSFSL